MTDAAGSQLADVVDDVLIALREAEQSMSTVPVNTTLCNVLDEAELSPQQARLVRAHLADEKLILADRDGPMFRATRLLPKGRRRASVAARTRDTSEEALAASTASETGTAMYKFFISHTSSSSEFGGAILATLLERGLRLKSKEVFFSSHPDTGVPPGEAWFESIRKVLIEKPVLIVALTDDYFSSPMSLLEAGAAWGSGDGAQPIVLRLTSNTDRGIFENVHVLDADSVDQVMSFIDVAASRSGIAPPDAPAQKRIAQDFVGQVGRIAAGRTARPPAASAPTDDTAKELVTTLSETTQVARTLTTAAKEPSLSTDFIKEQLCARSDELETFVLANPSYAGPIGEYLAALHRVLDDPSDVSNLNETTVRVAADVHRAMAN